MRRCVPQPRRTVRWDEMGSWLPFQKGISSVASECPWPRITLDSWSVFYSHGQVGCIAPVRSAFNWKADGRGKRPPGSTIHPLTIPFFFPNSRPRVIENKSLNSFRCEEEVCSPCISIKPIIAVQVEQFITGQQQQQKPERVHTYLTSSANGAIVIISIKLLVNAVQSSSVSKLLPFSLMTRSWLRTFMGNQRTTLELLDE